jgi:hypothetical protein
MKNDLRRYAAQTSTRLIAGALLLLFILGPLLIGFIYGPAAALMGFLCLLGALIPIGLIMLFIFGLDWIVKKGNEE